jgi:hypothetical protein
VNSNLQTHIRTHTGEDFTTYITFIRFITSMYSNVIL